MVRCSGKHFLCCNVNDGSVTYEWRLWNDDAADTVVLPDILQCWVDSNAYKCDTWVMIKKRFRALYLREISGTIYGKLTQDKDFLKDGNFWTTRVALVRACAHKFALSPRGSRFPQIYILYNYDQIREVWMYRTVCCAFYRYQNRNVYYYKYSKLPHDWCASGWCLRWNM